MVVVVAVVVTMSFFVMAGYSEVVRERTRNRVREDVDGRSVDVSWGEVMGGLW